MLAMPVLAEPPGFAGGVLGNLPLLKDFSAARISSVDPTGGNADGRHDWPMQPGETRTIADIEGAGAITHLWFTIASKDENHLRNIVLRMYWDGEEHPSVESPIGDFFGLGHAKYYLYSSLAIQIGSDRGMNCYWRMPFGDGARVTITNDGPLKIDAFYYYIDYEKRDRLPDNVARFHAQYRQAFPCVPGENYVFMEATGQGHFVGCNLSVHSRANGWWGEGDDMFFIDGETETSILGTGSEDYFCGAWCYGESKTIPFGNPYFGAPFIEGDHAQNSLWNVYRHHIEDPIPFTKSIRATIEHGHGNDRKDDFASVAYWYQTEPHVPFSPLPSAEERMFEPATVFTEAWGAIEAEALAPLFQNPQVTSASTEAWGNYWSHGKHLFFDATEPTAYRCTMPNAASDAGTYSLEIWHTAGPDYGICEVWLNGEKVAEWDGYNADGVVRKKLEERAVMTLRGEGNELEVRITGKQEESKGYKAGWDCSRVRF